jgi:hypothetical protein
MRIESRRWRVLGVAVACAMASVLAYALAPGGEAASAATANTLVSANVPSETHMSTAACPNNLPGTTDLGSLLPGSSAVSTGDCGIDFGSTNDSSMLQLYQDDGGGQTMRWRAASSTLVADWPMNGNGADVSSAANPLTFTGGTSFTAGMAALGQTLTLDGTTGYGQAPWLAVYDLPDDFTVSAWYRTSDMTGAGGYAIIVEKSTSCGTNCNFMIDLRRSDNLLIFGVSVGGSLKEVTAPGAATIDGQWHHVAGVVTAARVMSLYLDGNSVGTPLTLAGPVDTQAVPITVGRERSLGTNYFHGDIDEVVVQHHAITPAEVKQAFTNRVADYGGAGATWAAANGAFFGACLSSVASGAATDGTTWAASAGCPQSDGAWWHAVPATSASAGAKVAMLAASGTGRANLRFALRASSSQPSGAYTARLIAAAVAPNV